MHKEMQGLIGILVTALLWSFLGVLSKICLSIGLTPLQCAFFRSFFGAVAFIVHCLCTHTLLLAFKDCLAIFVFGAWGIGVYYSCAQYTIELAGAAMDIVLQYTAPFWVALFARVFFAETLTVKQMLALILACMGTCIVCFSGGSLPESAPLLGICTGLLTGLCYASHFLVIRSWQKRFAQSSIFAWMLLGGATVLFCVTSIHSGLPSSIPLKALICLFIMGVACTYCAFLTYSFALQRIGLVQAAITSELEPLLSIFWVCVFFGESFSLCGWVGAGLILVAVFVLAIKERKSC